MRMTKLVQIVMFLLWGNSLFAQGIFTPSSPTTYGSNNLRLNATTTLHIPTISGPPNGLVTLNSSLVNNAAMVFDKTNKKLYVWQPVQQTWAEVTGGGGGGLAVSDSLPNSGYTRRDRTKQVIDSLGNIVDGNWGKTTSALKALSTSGVGTIEDQVELTTLNTTTLRILPLTSGIFKNRITTTYSGAVLTMPQKDYPLTQLITATGGNINLQPIVGNGTFVRYIGYDYQGNIISSSSNFLSNEDVIGLGNVIVINTGGVVTFLDGTTAGGRNVNTYPELAENNTFQRESSKMSSTIGIGVNNNTSMSNTAGVLSGMSINWHQGTRNPNNTSSINKLNITAANPFQFILTDPTSLTPTTPPTPHTLWNTLVGGIQINRSYFNTTTGARGTIGNNLASIKRLLLGNGGKFIIQEGEFAGTTNGGFPAQNPLTALEVARNNLSTFQFTDLLPSGSFTEIGRIAFVENSNDFTNETQFLFVLTGSGGGGSSAVPTVSDATNVSKGVIQLAGDLNGTASLPGVKGINGVALSGLGTGLLKNTTGTGTPSIAIQGTDYAKTMQDAYTAGQLITTTTPLGPVTVKRGSNNDSDFVSQVQNGAGVRTYGVKGDGTIYSPKIAATENKAAIVLPNGNVSSQYTERVFNVKDYGAKGDSTTDDTQSLQNAFNAAANGGGTVFLPKGNYVISKGLRFYANMTIKGEGREVSHIITKLFGAGESLGDTTAHSQIMLYGEDAESVIMDGFHLRGTSIDGGFCGGIEFALKESGNVGHVVIKNLLITDLASGYGLEMNTPILTNVTNVKVLRVAGTGFYMFDGTSVTMNECYAITTTEAGFLFKTMTYCVFNSCACEVSGIGFDFVSSSAIVLNGCGTEGILNRNSDNQKYEDGAYKPSFDGRAFKQVGSNVQLNSCYSRDPATSHTQGNFTKINMREFTLIPLGVTANYNEAVRTPITPKSTLQTGISSTATSFTLATGTGSTFPSSDFYVSIYPNTYPSAFAAYNTESSYGGAQEWIYVSSRTGDVCQATIRGTFPYDNKCIPLNFNTPGVTYNVDVISGYKYAVTFFAANGNETALSDYIWWGYKPMSQMNINDIPTSSDPLTFGRKLYRTSVFNGTSSDNFYLIKTFNDNYTTTWIDDVVDNGPTVIPAGPEPTLHKYATTNGSSNISIENNRFAVGNILKVTYNDFMPYPFSRGTRYRYKVLLSAGNTIQLSKEEDLTNTAIIFGTTTAFTNNLYIYRYDMPGEDLGIINDQITQFKQNTRFLGTITSDSLKGNEALTYSNFDGVLSKVTLGTNLTLIDGILSAQGQGGGVDGGGTVQKLAKWTGATSLGNSAISDNGTDATVNGTVILGGLTAAANKLAFLGLDGKIGAAVIGSGLSFDGTTLTAAGGGGGMTGTGVPGQVPFFTGTSALSGDAGFVWNNTTKRLGINVAVPASALNVLGDIQVENTGLFYNKGTSKIQYMLNTAGAGFGSIGNNTTGSFFLGWTNDYSTTVGTPVLYWNQSNKVGIKQPTPAYELDVNGSIGYVDAYSVGNTLITGDNKSILFKGGNNEIRWRDGSSNNLGNLAAATTGGSFSGLATAGDFVLSRAYSSAWLGKNLIITNQNNGKIIFGMGTTNGADYNAMELNQNAQLRINSLIGTGNRVVVAMPDGTLNIQGALLANAYTPTVVPNSNVTAGAGLTSRYFQIGNIVFVTVIGNVTATSVGSTTFSVGLPVNAVAYHSSGIGQVTNSTTGIVLKCVNSTTSDITLRFDSPSVGYVAQFQFQYSYSVN